MSEALGRLLALVDRLRAPDGCPWDRSQTSRTLLPYIREELAEVAMATQEQRAPGVEEELGEEERAQRADAKEAPQPRALDADREAAALAASVPTRGLAPWTCHAPMDSMR